MKKKKWHVILTTKKSGEFAVSTDQVESQDQLIEFAKQWVAKLNASYAGTDMEVTNFRPATDEEVKSFDELILKDFTPDEQK